MSRSTSLNNQPVPRLGRTPSRFRMRGTPIIMIMLASMLPALLPLISQAPTLPPLGLLFLLSWRLLRHDMLPLWIGAPLGAVDDLMSGNPLGTAIFLWSAIMIAMEMLDDWLQWRSYWHDWLIAILACIVFLGGALLINRFSGSLASPMLILPQLFWSALLYPFVVRITVAMDRWRMMA
ncbi:MAG: rod shape-determining protein MreD [Sphingobium sp.]|nr:rod shape-determining protein MreD [Sphingobium sp.]